MGFVFCVTQRPVQSGAVIEPRHDFVGFAQFNLPQLAAELTDMGFSPYNLPGCIKIICARPRTEQRDQILAAIGRAAGSDNLGFWESTRISSDGLLERVGEPIELAWQSATV